MKSIDVALSKQKKTKQVASTTCVQLASLLCVLCVCMCVCVVCVYVLHAAC